MIAKGRVHLYGNHIDTDVIIPARVLNNPDPKNLAAHCMEDIDPSFSIRVRAGDIIVAGINFGCGSSREHAPIAIKASGIQCVIAENFARIFYRNSINIGLPLLESKEASHDIKDSDELEIDYENGKILNLTSGKKYQALKFPEFVRNIIKVGGLVNYAKIYVNKQF
ncbi:MAG: 3-isopropylmalate dehydratase small subunit [Christensenellaceae bacterium]|jgi:3-isopropylmalate/(R)-2-methylmalate dehydratase small subunit|nr:3-isopropylmalate dehydratase small subunit [Christensenellaceae bacterium]